MMLLVCAMVPWKVHWPCPNCRDMAQDIKRADTNISAITTAVSELSYALAVSKLQQENIFPNYPASENSIKFWSNRTINCSDFQHLKNIMPPPKKIPHQFQPMRYWLAAIWSAMRSSLLNTKFVVCGMRSWQIYIYIYIINWQGQMTSIAFVYSTVYP